MIVSELIDKLCELPPDMVVFRDVEGELRPVENPHVAELHTWSIGGNVSVDYDPDCQLDDEEAKFRGVIID